MSGLKLFLLGPPRVELDGTAVDLQRRKALALLIYLAITGQPHSRDTLATFLWPDYSQSQARAYLRRDLAVLNASLAGEWLSADREIIELKRTPQLWLDVAEFGQFLATCDSHDHPANVACTNCLPLLTQAAALYTGDFLAGFTLRDSPEFDDWQFFQTESLRHKLASTLERLVRGLSDRGEYEAAISQARRWLALDPLHEPAQYQLIQLYDQAGQPAAALRQYEEYVKLLEEELGLPPEEETTTLYEAIKAKRMLGQFIKTQQRPPSLAWPEIGRSEEELPGASQMPVTLGRYELLIEIGQGGFATVYRARDRDLDRLVALKALRAHLLSDTNWVKRFHREARLIARLAHPRIVPIYDVGQVQRRHFIVMQLVEGPNLADMLAEQGRLPWPEAVKIISAIVEGLDYAHRQGILHRDLKPANILIDLEHGPLLSDFGLAKLVGESSLSQSRDVVGTLYYIAPEVWEGQAVTPQTDIYALGCILYEMVTGEKLFTGETPPAVMTAHFQPLTFPESWPEGVPSGVADVLLKALTKHPEDRYATAGEMMAALARLKTDEPTKVDYIPEAAGQDAAKPKLLPQPQGRRSPDSFSSSSGHVSCPACGALASQTQQFCSQCGTPLRQFCPVCGTENPLNSRFCRQCGTMVAEAAPVEAKPVSELIKAKPHEERRWVTVLFANVSGFTTMSEQMDPEDMKLLADRCARRLSQEVRRVGGTVLNIVGDEVVAVFGAPAAHEDDPERAMRAGLAMASLNLSDEPDQQVQVHVVVNTGEVMAGFLGPQERRDYTVMGDTVNTAARLLPAAPPGSVLVGVETYRATQHVVNYRELPPLAVKGKDKPVPVWEALDVVALPQARPFGTAPFIGRDQELDRLLAMWSWVADHRQPHLMTILGDAGLGKSRLVAEFEQRLPGGVTVLHGHCLPYGEARSYGALEMMLKEAAGITAEDEAEIARAKLGALVEGVIEPDGTEGDPQELAQHLALMSGLDVEADRLAGSQDERVFRVSARRFLTALARRSPLCLIFNNIHWADTALLDLIEHVAARVQQVPLLVITQSRPELLESRATWGRGVQSFTSLVLQPLDPQAEQALMLALCREHGLPDEIATQMGRKVGGNPLYAEELVAMVAEQGKAAGTPLAIKLLISARLDTLPEEERQTLKIASVFGRVFWEGGLRLLAGRQVTEPLEALEQKGLLRAQIRSHYPGEREYAFKHDLIRDVAYELLPRAERRVLHGQVADWFEQTLAEHREAYYDLLAHHAVEANQPERAITYLIQAAERAGRATAHRQEAALLGKAMALAQHLNQHALVADLRVRRGRAFINLGRWAEAQQELEIALTELDPEDIEQRVRVLADLAWIRFWLIDVSGQREAANKAMALAEKIDRDDLVAKAMFAVGFSRMNDAELQATQDLCRGALNRAGDAAIMELAMAAWASGIVSFWHGDFEAAIESQRQAVQMGHNRHYTIPTAIALPQLGLAMAAHGRYDEAEAVFDKSRQFGREYELWPFLARAMAMSAGYHLDLFDYANHERIAAEARELGLSLKFPAPTMSASIDLLLNFARRQEVGRYEQLVDEVAEFVEKAPGFHGWLWRSRFAEAQAEIALVRGDLEEALHWAERGISRSHQFGRVKYHALNLESRAKILLKLDRTHEAIADLKSATAMIRSIGDPAIFLRVAASLLAIEGDDSLLAETQATAQRIITALPDEAVRRHFEAAEPVQLLAKLAG